MPKSDGNLPREVSINALKKLEQPEEVYRVSAIISEAPLESFLLNNGAITKDFSDEEALQRLGKLVNAKAVRIQEEAADCKLKYIGRLEYSAKDPNKVTEDLKGELDKNIREFVHLIEATKFA